MSLRERVRDRRPVPAQIALWAGLAIALALLLTNHRLAGPLVLLTTVIFAFVTTRHYNRRQS